MAMTVPMGRTGELDCNEKEPFPIGRTTVTALMRISRHGLPYQCRDADHRNDIPLKTTGLDGNAAL